MLIPFRLVEEHLHVYIVEDPQQLDGPMRVNSAEYLLVTDDLLVCDHGKVKVFGRVQCLLRVFNLKFFFFEKRLDFLKVNNLARKFRKISMSPVTRLILGSSLGEFILSRVFGKLVAFH